ncbi:MAG: hypothetical protein IJ379_01320 [Lachnospiraceae bacterium]|nr:hypothetical protein [Lachnospiraceae bacterium]
MKVETLSNLIQGGVWLLLGLSALTGAIFFGAWWHFFTAAICGVFVWLMFTDDQYGTESVKSYFQRIAKKRK